eukprot:scaffold52_cov290-Prasinococcus_capsulatus_cf.AAC.2
MQDVGARFYTYIWTLYDTLVAAALSDGALQVLVLDRPNPLGGLAIEGEPRPTLACARLFVCCCYCCCCRCCC